MCKVFRGIDKLIEWIIIVGMIGLIIACFLGVFSRTVIGSSLYWTDELMRYLFINVTFYGSPLLVYRKSHIVVDITDLIFPAKFRPALEVFTDVGLIIFGLVMAYLTLPLVEMGMMQRSSSMHIPMSIVYLCMPLGFLMTAVNGGRLLYDFAKSSKLQKEG